MCVLASRAYLRLASNFVRFFTKFHRGNISADCCHVRPCSSATQKRGVQHRHPAHKKLYDGEVGFLDFDRTYAPEINK